MFVLLGDIMLHDLLFEGSYRNRPDRPFRRDIRRSTSHFLQRYQRLNDRRRVPSGRRDRSMAPSRGIAAVTTSELRIPSIASRRTRIASRSVRPGAERAARTAKISVRTRLMPSNTRVVLMGVRYSRSTSQPTTLINTSVPMPKAAAIAPNTARALASQQGFYVKCFSLSSDFGEINEAHGGDRCARRRNQRQRRSRVQSSASPYQ